jgi:cell division protein FtsL
MTGGLVYRKQRGSVISFGRGLFVLMILAIGMLLYVYEQVAGAALATDMSRLVQIRKVRMDHSARLKAEIAYLSRSERIKQIASEELGMKFPVRRSLALRLDQAPTGGRYGDEISGFGKFLVASREWLGRSAGVFGNTAEAQTCE